MKPYSSTKFLNVGIDIAGIDPFLTNVLMSDGCLKLAIKWVMIDYLNLVHCTLSLLSVGDRFFFKILSAPVKLLLRYCIDC